MPGGRAPYVYWVDLDSGISYWQPPPLSAMMGGAVSGLDALWIPQGVVGTADGDVSPLPLKPTGSGVAKENASAKTGAASVAATGSHARG